MNKVFIVDDDRYVRKGILELIDWIGCGYQICGEADNGEDAFEMIKKEEPDLVVTDIRMPVLDGLDLIKNIVETTDLNTNFIIISGYNDFKYAQRAMRYGVHDFILKPIDKGEFENTLKRLSVEINKGKIDERSREKRLAISTLDQLLEGKVEPSNVDTYIEKLNLKNVLEMWYILIEVNDLVSDSSNIINVMQKEIEFITQYKYSLIKEHKQGVFGSLINNKQLHLFGLNIKKFIDRLQTELSRKLNKPITFYIGKPVENPLQIRESYKTAKKASQFKYAISTDTTIYYEDIESKEVNYIKLDQAYYDTLMEHVIENNTDKILKTIDEMIVEFESKMFAKDAVKTTINRCVHDVIRLIKMREGDESKLSTLDEMLNWDEKPLTIAQVKSIFTQFVLEGSKYIFKLNQEQTRGTIYKIKEYVDMHYDENLTLKGIAKKFYMNPAYLGQLFKKEYGVYFRDYFRQVRINEAKKRLRQTDMRVYEIAEEVGFDNPDYFVTQFRKEVGMTPMNYRKKFYSNLKDNKHLEKDGDNYEAFPH